ncbi:MAG: DUF1326 domain-containing protein [Acidobacteria bacterium]|nr:DUF1326 domain-containing protein [Acidobacteriota bacterium]
MKKVWFTLMAIALFLGAATLGLAGEIRGNYVEARNADVWVAHCFANSEVGLVGDLAVMAWQIEQGSWNNVTLDGLGVVAVVRAKSTLGDPYHNPYPAKAVLILDERANMEQRLALQSFVKKMAGDLVQTVVRVDTAPVTFDFNGNLHAGKVQMAAGQVARIETRAIMDGDAVCHNAFTYYPPLTKLDHAMPARTVENRFAGDGLNVVWSSPNKNSAFLGSFVTESE